jgi:hypothetical protein
MEKMTDTDFAALPRWPNGRLMDLAVIFFMLTPKQVEQLHGDDWSYYNELQEEVEYEISLLS